MPSEVLHVAALPFPSSQGTQAALSAIVRAHAEALAERGSRASLLTYAHGDGRSVLPSDVEHRRTRAPMPNASLRSGPSFAKVLEDGALVWAVRSALEPRIVAHHVEAALACVLAGRRFDWVVHTALGPELPLYLPHIQRFAPVLRRFGERLDRLVATRADRVLAVSPGLAERLARDHGVDARWLPIPWVASAPVHECEREQARAAFGFRPDDEVLLYAGNLDAYQGLDVAVEAVALLAHRRSRLRWLVATESDPVPFLLQAARRGIAARIVLGRLSDGATRRRAHAAADVALVPRKLDAGVAVKIFEALAHRIPTVAVRAATGGHPLEEACVLVDDDPRTIAAAISRVLESPFERLALAAAGPMYLDRHHEPRACAAVLT